jgi:hypothetical protein
VNLRRPKCKLKYIFFHLDLIKFTLHVKLPLYVIYIQTWDINRTFKILHDKDMIGKGYLIWPTIYLYSIFVGPWPLFQVLNPVHSQQDSVDGG